MMLNNGLAPQGLEAKINVCMYVRIGFICH